MEKRPSLFNGRLNLLYQALRRFISALRIPAIPIMSLGGVVWATWLGGGWRIAPSKAQVGALRRENSPKEIGFFSNLLASIPPGEGVGVILDVGANLGYSTMKYKAASDRLLSSNWQFFCVEPNWRNFPFISHNLKDVDGWRLLPFAVSRRCGFIEGGIPQRYSWRGRSVFSNTGLFTTTSGIELRPSTTNSVAGVGATELREFLGGSQVLFCKVDIEGSERLFLEQVCDWLLDGRTFVQVEINPGYQSSQDKAVIRDLVESRDYSIMTQSLADLEGTHEWFLIPNRLVGSVETNCGLKSSLHNDT